MRRGCSRLARAMPKGARACSEKLKTAVKSKRVKKWVGVYRKTFRSKDENAEDCLRRVLLDLGGAVGRRTRKRSRNSATAKERVATIHATREMTMEEAYWDRKVTKGFATIGCGV